MFHSALLLQCKVFELHYFPVFFDQDLGLKGLSAAV